MKAKPEMGKADGKGKKRQGVSRPPQEKKVRTNKPEVFTEVNSETSSSSSEDESRAQGKSVCFSKAKVEFDQMSVASSDENTEPNRNSEPKIRKSDCLNFPKEITPRAAVANITAAMVEMKDSCKILLQNGTERQKVEEHLTKFNETVYNNCINLLLFINEQQDKVHQLELALTKKSRVTANTVIPEGQNQRSRATRNRDRSASRTRWSTIVKAQDDEQDSYQAFKNAIKDQKPEEIGGPFVQVVKLKSGKTIIETATEKDHVKLKETLESRAKETLLTRQFKTSRPIMVIKGVDSLTEMNEENIAKEIAENNPDIFQQIGLEDMEKGIKFLTKRKCRNPAKTDWKIEVSPEVYKVLIKKDKIVLDYTLVGIREHIDVTRCFKCNLYGHVSKYCKATNETCPKCAEEYKDKESHVCPTDKICCTNCKILGLKQTDHYSFDNKCPIYIRKMKQASQLVNYGNN